MESLIVRNPTVDIPRIVSEGITKAILDRCTLNEDDAFLLQQALSSSSCNLLTLHLFCTTWTSTNAFRSMAEGLALNTSLSILYLCGDYHTEVTYLGAAIAINTTLRELHLWDNRLDTKNAMILATYVQRNVGLQKLHVPRNWISSDGATALLQASNRNTTIQELHLSHNDVVDLDLCGISSLSILHLDGNAMLNISTIAHGLATNPFVKELSLANCGLNTSDFVLLATSLQTNTNLTKLTVQQQYNNKNRALDYNKAEQALLKVLRDCNNVTLTEIDLPQFPTILHYLQFNRSGRQLLSSHDSSSETPTTDGVWPLVLAKIRTQPALLYEYLKAKPEWFRLS